MLLTPEEIEIFEKMRTSLLKMPKYSPEYNPNKKTTEKDFHIIFIDTVADEKASYSEENWSKLQEHLFETFFKNGGLTAKELNKWTFPEQDIENKKSVFSEAARKRMIDESRFRERGLQEEKDLDDEHPFTIVNGSRNTEESRQQEEFISPKTDSQLNIAANAELTYLSKKQRDEELEAEYLKNIQKNIPLR